MSGLIPGRAIDYNALAGLRHNPATGQLESNIDATSALSFNAAGELTTTLTQDTDGRGSLDPAGRDNRTACC